MAGSGTVRDPAARIVELGLVDFGAVVAVDPACPDEDLVEEYGESTADAVVNLLVELGAGFQVHTDDLEAGYATALEELAACTDGALTVTDVELVDDRVLRFRCNGEWREWEADHQHPEYLDQMVFVERIDSLTPAGPRRWATPENEDLPVGRFVSGEPTALRALGADFGVEFLNYE